MERRLHLTVNSRDIINDINIKESITYKERKESSKNNLPENISLRCKYCDIEATTPSYLLRHMFEEHDHNAIFCHLCGEKCMGKTRMQYHIDYVHTKIKQYKCQLCDLDFQTKKGLGRHHRLKHTHIKDRYICQECGKGFDAKQTLDWHMNVHLGLKPYKCEFCGQGFQNPSNMITHKKKSCKQRL